MGGVPVYPLVSKALPPEQHLPVLDELRKHQARVAVSQPQQNWPAPRGQAEQLYADLCALRKAALALLERQDHEGTSWMRQWPEWEALRKEVEKP